jgi:NADPH-dependent curcumin reductase
VRNLVTSVDPYQLRMLRGSPEVTPVRIGEPVPANSVGVVVQSEDRGVPLGTQVATYTGWQAIAGGRHRTDRAVQVLGADVAVDYRDPDLEEAASEGIDVFFDNVGGRQLTLALSVLKNYASVVLCGWVSSYARPDDPEGCAVLRDAVFKRITLRGFIVSDFYPERLLPIRTELATLLRTKQLRAVVSEFVGLERAPEALATVFDRGSPYIGRRVVRISDA